MYVDLSNVSDDELDDLRDNHKITLDQYCYEVAVREGKDE